MLKRVVAPDTPFNGIINAESTDVSHHRGFKVVARPALTASERLNSNEQNLMVRGYRRRIYKVLNLLDN